MRSARLSLMLEIASHDPFRKRIKKVREQTILATVYSGNWPRPTESETLVPCSSRMHKLFQRRLTCP